jgi:hypothetical protein
MLPTPPTQPGKLLRLPQELTSSRAVVAVLLVEVPIVTRMIGSVPRRVIGSSQLMMVESAVPTRDYRGSRVPQEHVGIKNHTPRCLMLKKMMMSRLILLMETRSQNFREQFHLHTFIREDIFIGQNFADFDIDLSFSNLLMSICQRMAKKLETDDDEIEYWWDCERQKVHQHLKSHRSNTIQGRKSHRKN